MNTTSSIKHAYKKKKCKERRPVSKAQVESICQRCTNKQLTNLHCETGPYSHFRVGAVLLTTSTSHPHVAGANVENAAYPSGFCAERAAIGAAIGGLGMRRGEIRAVAVATDLVAAEQGDGEENLEGFASPCGMCRQVLREFCDVSVNLLRVECGPLCMTERLTRKGS